MTAPWSRLDLRTRLIVAFVSILLGALAVSWLVVELAGPQLFRSRFQRSAAVPTSACKLLVNAETAVLIDADQERLGQVLTNLLNNALRHTPTGGEVSVRVEPRRDAVHVVVHDTSEGIAAQHLPHVFERFYRAHPASGDTGGSGIGLTISPAIVAGHHGRITVHSAGPGHGTEVRIILPRVG